jgi:hypothetical protein
MIEKYVEDKAINILRVERELESSKKRNILDTGCVPICGAFNESQNYD